jgi:hypothetical protein
MSSDNLKYPRSLIAIGYWQSESLPELPHPKDFQNDQITPDERKFLIDYLGKGKVVMMYLGYSFCRFKCGTPDHEMGNSCLTDGHYIWPEKLSHYIREHNVWLPESFIFHAKANRHYNPLDIDLKKQLDPYDQIDPRKYNYHDYEWWTTCKDLK